LPKVCPICWGAIEIKGEMLACSNQACSGKEANRINKFLEALNVKGLGWASLVLYCERGITLADFLKDRSLAEVAGKIRGGDVISWKIFQKIRAQLQ
jgi:hypothetical protein